MATRTMIEHLDGVIRAKDEEIRLLRERNAALPRMIAEYEKLKLRLDALERIRSSGRG